MCEATDTAGDVGTVAAILRGAERGAPGCFILAPRDKQTPLSLSDQHGGGRGGRRRRWGPRPIVVVLLVRAKEVDHVEKVYEVQVLDKNHIRYTALVMNRQLTISKLIPWNVSFCLTSHHVYLIKKLADKFLVNRSALVSCTIKPYRKLACHKSMFCFSVSEGLSMCAQWLTEREEVDARRQGSGVLTA